MTDDAGVPEVYDSWLSALGAAESSLEHLRDVYPSKIMLMAETGHEAIRRAMDNMQGAVGQLHRAGRFVMGEQYEDFIRDRVDSRTSRAMRGDLDG